MLRCVKRKSSKSRTPTPSNSNERGCSTLPRMRHRSESDENVSEKPSSSSSRLTRWAMEKKSATLTAGCTLSGNESKTKSKPFTFLRTLSLSSLFSPSRRRRKMTLLQHIHQPNIQQREDETDVSPSEGSLTPTAEETYQHGLNEVQKQDLFLKKLTKEAFSFSRDETNKTPTDEKPNVLPEQKHFNRHSDEQHDSGRSSTRESAEVSLASDKPRKDIVNGFPNESVKHLTVGLKRAHVAAEDKTVITGNYILRIFCSKYGKIVVKSKNAHSSQI
ncbi:unnamed protein product [Heterobilharzia americana]|nr:unnamed protein product [Heterobilharzia americana]